MVVVGEGGGRCGVKKKKKRKRQNRKQFERCPVEEEEIRVESRRREGREHIVTHLGHGDVMATRL